MTCMGFMCHRDTARLLPRPGCLCWVGIFAAMFPHEEAVVGRTLRHPGGLPYTQGELSGSEPQTLIQRLQGDGSRWAPPRETPDTPGARCYGSAL